MLASRLADRTAASVRRRSIALASPGPAGCRHPGRGELGHLRDADHRDPHALDRGHVGRPGRGGAGPDPHVGEPGGPGRGQRVGQADGSVVQGVVVGHRDQVDAGVTQRGEGGGRGAEMKGLGLRRAAGGDRGLQVHRGEVSRPEHRRDRAERGGRVGQQPRRAAGEVHVTGERQRDAARGAAGMAPRPGQPGLMRRWRPGPAPVAVGRGADGAAVQAARGSRTSTPDATASAPRTTTITGPAGKPPSARRGSAGRGCPACCSTSRPWPRCRRPARGRGRTRPARARRAG